MRVVTPRTLLFVPGDRPERVTKARESGCDGIIIDLEDAVADAAKADARRMTSTAIEQLPAGRSLVGVRVNGTATGLMGEDLTALAAALSGVDFIMLPKAAAAGDIHTLAARLTELERTRGIAAGSIKIIPLVETARGILAAADIAGSDPRVMTLALGTADLSLELGVTPSREGEELLFARSSLVLAAAAAQLPAPIDGPHFHVDDEESLVASVMTAARLGFAGKLVIHPQQVAPVHKALRPSDRDLAWAAEVDARFTDATARGVSAIKLADGTFVDPPVAARARALLARSELDN